MKVRFQADADLRQSIVRGVRRREPAIDFKTAGESALEGRDDLQVLALAAEEGRVLVSHDFRTMPHHFARFIQGGTGAGLVLISQDLPIRVAIEELILIWLATEAEEWKNRIAYLPL